MKGIFEELFVLEMANNHWGRLDRGLRIMDEFSKVAKANNVRAALKIQLRDVDTFIHPAHTEDDARYIKKTRATKMSRDDFAELVYNIRLAGCIPMATPFDEASVDFCVELELPLLKLASSDINDRPLIEKIASTRLPVIASTGGASQEHVDQLVKFFDDRAISLALNHCVALYPTEDADLDLNQIDYLVKRYPGVTVGLSTHEYNNWDTSIAIAYAKGARTFERHVDIDADDIPVSPYCSLPDQVDTWLQAFNRAKAMCGVSSDRRRIPTAAETDYLTGLVRGVYAKRDLQHAVLTADDYFLAIPLLEGQLSCRDLLQGELTRPVAKNEPIMRDGWHERPRLISRPLGWAKL